MIMSYDVKVARSDYWCIHVTKNVANQTKTTVRLGFLQSVSDNNKPTTTTVKSTIQLSHMPLPNTRGTYFESLVSG